MALRHLPTWPEHITLLFQACPQSPLPKLEADYLGHECGQGAIGIDAKRRKFVLHRMLDGEMGYPEFEKVLTAFVQAARYRKAWLTQPQGTQGAAEMPRFPIGGMLA
ncbi:MAG: type III secretion system chaperone [Desulfovibrio sp.]|nr:type III secretion system chaperone [Desulfovibrio sp.]